jgi:hypothetical protein
MEKSKGTLIFRIVVLVLLAAILAVNSVTYVKVCKLTEETEAAEDEVASAKPTEPAEPAATQEPDQAEQTSTQEDDFLYSYDWAFNSFNYVEVKKLGLTDGDWRFEISIQGTGTDLVLEEIYINDLVGGNITEEYTNPDWLNHMREVNGIADGEDIVLPASGSLYWTDGHPYADSFDGREYRFVFSGPDGGATFSFIYELNGEETSTINQVDYSTDHTKDLAKVRDGAQYEIEVFEGVYWVPAYTLGASRYENAEIYAMLGDTPEQKQQKISTLYEALQLYQIGNFTAADDNIRVNENGVNWEYHTPGRQAVENNCGCCATSSAWLRYILDGDYDELGYISTSQLAGDGHVYNYIRQGEWYYIIDMTKYRNDAFATIVENGDMNAYMLSDRVLGNIHRTKDLSLFVNYVQDAFSDPPALMFRLTCEDVPPIDVITVPEGLAVVHPESYEKYITLIFDNPSDNLTDALAADPEQNPYK